MKKPIRFILFAGICVWLAILYWYSERKMWFPMRSLQDLLETVFYFFASGTLFLCAYGLGAKLFGISGLKFSHDTDRYIFGTGLGVGCFSYIILFLGVTGVLYAWAVGALLLVISVWARREMAGLLLHLKETVKKGAFARLDLSGWEQAFLLFIVLYAALNFLNSLVPSWRFGDAESYHMPALSLYLKYHRIFFIPHMRGAHMPFTVNLFYLPALLTGNKVAAMVIAQFLHTVFGLLSLFILYRMALRYMPRPYALLSAGIFYSMGFIGVSSSGAIVDLGRFFFEILAVYGFFLWDDAQGKERRKWLVLSSVAVGLAMGSKILSWVSFFFLTAGVAWRSLARIKRPALVFKESGLYLLIAFLVVLPWHVRSFLYTGNPFAPFPVIQYAANFLTTGSMGVQNRDAGFITVSLSLSDILSIPWQMTIDGFRFGNSQWPANIFYLALLPLVFFVFRSMPAHILFMLFFSLAWFIFGAVPLGFRYYIISFALLSITVVYSVWRLFSRTWMVRVLFGLFMAVFISDLYKFISYGDLTRHLPVIFGLQTREYYLSENLSHYSAEVFANHNLSDHDRILLLGSNQFYYCDRDIEGDMERFFEDRRRANSSGSIRKYLHSRRYTHVLIDIRSLRDREGKAVYPISDIGRYDLSQLDHPFFRTGFYKTCAKALFLSKGACLYSLNQ
ncbi:MAG: hypothetical protein PHF84_00550 [bacterium]|nr:hypothetical protein [bacterium]